MVMSRVQIRYAFLSMDICLIINGREATEQRKNKKRGFFSPRKLSSVLTMVTTFTLDSSSLALVLVFWLLFAAFRTRKRPHSPALAPLHTRPCRLSLPFCGKQAAERRGVWLQLPRQETGMARKGGLLGQTLGMRLKMGDWKRKKKGEGWECYWRCWEPNYGKREKSLVLSEPGSLSIGLPD